MTETTQCPACGNANAIGAEGCASCGEPFPTIDVASSRDVTPGDVRPPPPGDSEAAALRSVAERMARHRLAGADSAPPRAGTAAWAAAGRPPHHAGFVVRLVAFAIDIVVLGSFTVPLSMAVICGVKTGLFASKTPVRFVETEEALHQLIGYAWLAMAALYFTVLHRSTGQTIGKAVVGIAVRRARDLASIGIIRSVLRVLGYVLSAGVFLLGFLTVMLNPRKRGWHDYVAGTCVVHLAPEEV
jgi:uncharacterized RDD family membrane protein YckC